MIGKLKKTTVRTVHSKKVCRLRIDIPYSEVDKLDMENEDMLKWLNNNVDSEIGINITTLEDQDQQSL